MISTIKKRNFLLAVIINFLLGKVKIDAIIILRIEMS